MTDSVMEVAGLRKIFRGRGQHADVLAVDDVTFSLGRGESLAVVGESGSGKSTVARVLVGLESATAGSVSIMGDRRDGGRVSAAVRRRRARQIQMVFQDPYSSLDPLQSVGRVLRDAVALTGRAAGDRDARVRGLLESVGLQGRHAQLRPSQLSGGQRQRVAIARALAVEPAVLVLDEAVAALDVSVQAQVLNLLNEIRRATGTAYLFISHDLAVVNQVSERCLVMHRGRVVESGSTEQVLRHPREAYTQQLRDAIPRPGWRPRRSVSS